MQQVLQCASRDAAAPTFSPDGLYFLGPGLRRAVEAAQSTPLCLAAGTTHHLLKPPPHPTRMVLNKPLAMTRAHPHQNLRPDARTGCRCRRGGGADAVLRCMRPAPEQSPLSALPIGTQTPPFVTPVLLFVNANPIILQLLAQWRRALQCNFMVMKRRTLPGPQATGCEDFLRAPRIPLGPKCPERLTS